MKAIHLFVGLLLVMGLSACKPQQQKDTQSTSEQAHRSDFAFHTKLKYADGFQVINHEDYKEIDVKHPMTGQLMGKYITTLAGTVLPDSIKAKGVVIEVPARSIACLSTTEVGAVEVLNIRDKLVACGSPRYVWDTALAKRIEKGEIKEIARGMDVNTEQLVSAMPQLLMQSFADKTNADESLAKLGIHVLYNNSWKERNLLGRAEWLKFMALFFCKERMADSIFAAVEKHYYEVKTAAATTKHRPTVMYGADYKGTWYLPQSETYIAQTIRDANAIFTAAGEGNASVPKSFEEVYALFHDCEYWLSAQGKVQTMQDFLSSNERYIDFKAAQNQQVYTNNKREKLTGGNDYWESGINRPDLLLKDVVKILHPELFPEYETVYWQHLK